MGLRTATNVDVKSASSQSTTDTTPTYRLAFALVSLVFFSWGFLTCLNDILIPRLKSVFQLTYTQSALIQFTFFAAYFIVSLPAGRLIRWLGYKNGICVGLIVAAFGALMFGPAARAVSFEFFLAALFTLAAGIAILQVAANPYVSLLGPAQTSASRLNLAQALNSLGTTLAPQFGRILILSTGVMAAGELASLSGEALAQYRAEQIQAVQGPYLFLAGALICLALLIAVFRLPDFREDRSAASVAQAGQENLTLWSVLRIPQVASSVLAIFLYVGAEVAIGSFLINFLSLPNILALPESDAAHYVSYYWGGALIGRFVGSMALRHVRPAWALMFSAIAAMALVGVAVLGDGALAGYAVVLVGLFNAIMFPTIFDLGIQGLGPGPKTEKASALLVMAIVGGAILPLVYGALADQFGLQLSFLLPVACYAYIAVFGQRMAIAAKH